MNCEKKTLEATLEEVCSQKQCAENQRKSEISRGLGIAGTEGYEKMGCYDCDGKNTNCPAYYVLRGYNGNN